MSSTAENILDHLLGALAGLGKLADVRVGPDYSQGGVPRANVLPISHKTRPADDGTTRWHRLVFEVRLVTAGESDRAAAGRAMELFEQAQSALLADGFRGGWACHLPWGPATLVGPAELKEGQKSRMCEVRFEVTCHYESTGGA